MSPTEIGAIVGFGLLLLNAGIQWGIQVAARAQNAVDHDRLEKMVERVRSESGEADSRTFKASDAQLKRVEAEVDSLRDEMRQFFEGQRAQLSAMQASLATIATKIELHEQRLGALERAPR